MGQAEQATYTAQFEHQAIIINNANMDFTPTVTLRVKADSGMFFAKNSEMAKLHYKGNYYPARIEASFWDELSESTVFQVRMPVQWTGEADGKITLPLYHSENGIKALSHTIDFEAQNKIIDGSQIRYSVKKDEVTGETSVTVNYKNNDHVIAYNILAKDGKPPRSHSRSSSSSTEFLSQTVNKKSRYTFPKDFEPDSLHFYHIPDATKKRNIDITIPAQVPVAATPAASPSSEGICQEPEISVWLRGIPFYQTTNLAPTFILRVTSAGAGAVYINNCEQHLGGERSNISYYQAWVPGSNQLFLQLEPYSSDSIKNDGEGVIVSLKGRYSDKPYTELRGECNEKGGVLTLGKERIPYTVEIDRGIFSGITYEYEFTLTSPMCKQFNFYNAKGEKINMNIGSRSYDYKNGVETIKFKIETSEPIKEVGHLQLPMPHHELEMSCPLR